MTPLSWVRLAGLAAGVGAVAWIITRVLVTSGHTPYPVPWSVLVVSGAAAVLAFALGWAVRQYRKGDNPGLNPLRAARTAVYAHACAYAGAILAGAYGGYGLSLALDWSHGPRREVAISGFVAALGGIALVIAGLWVEHWCRADDDDDHKGGPGGAPTAGPGAAA
ncbi:DUF3180 domain-containing protein [Demequina pelophila]|uniref:DUF3180 domain-containing protein n=1 Tax=Demequina pelophila TaxID=1638984 RepID=UPI000A6AB2E2|nr:DUF3180 domain-containing protein [Demequina pelophila]